MAQVNITTNVSVSSLDGITPQPTDETFTASIQDYLEFSRDVPSSSQTVYTGAWSFAIICNVGSVDFIAEVALGGDFQTFVVPAGQFISLPSSFSSSTVDGVLGSALAVYTASGTSRALFAIGVNNT